ELFTENIDVFWVQIFVSFKLIIFKEAFAENFKVFGKKFCVSMGPLRPPRLIVRSGRSQEWKVDKVHPLS
ncbi:hypothetical protein LINPERPRIM_LOCUS6361, partial [Linum perenne]